MNFNDIASMKEVLDAFLAKEDSTLDKYDVLRKKAWLTIGKPEPQASEFVKILKNLIDSATKSDSWKILYKIKQIT